MLNNGTDLSCRWDTGGDSHRRIMAKHQALVRLTECQLGAMKGLSICYSCDVFMSQIASSFQKGRYVFFSLPVHLFLWIFADVHRQWGTPTQKIWLHMPRAVIKKEEFGCSKHCGRGLKLSMGAP